MTPFCASFRRQRPPRRHDPRPGATVTLTALLASLVTLWSLQAALADSRSRPFPGRDAFPGKGRQPFVLPVPEPAPPIAPNLPAAGAALEYPIRMFLTDSGWLLVSDSKRKAVFRVHPVTLLADQALPVDGTPLAVGMHGGEIFVGMMEEESIQVFSHEGVPQGYLVEPGAIGHPCDLAVDRTERLLLALDSMAGQVQVYDVATHTRLSSIGAGMLRSPAGLAVDPASQEVVVSDYGSSTEPASAKIFSYAAASFGAHVDSISGAGTCSAFGCTGGFSRPRGPAVHNGVVYIPDVIYAQVLMYSRESHAFVGALGTGDPAISDLRIPTDVEITVAGDVYVTSSYTGAVVVFLGAGR